MDRKAVTPPVTRSSRDRGAALPARGDADDLACLVSIVVESLRKLTPERRARLLASTITASGTGIVFEAETPCPLSNILRLEEVMTRTGLKRSTLYAKIANGTFPAQVKLSAKCVGWYEHRVDEWRASLR